MPIDQKIIEAARVVDSQEFPLALRLEQRVRTIAQKLFPELDWAATPLEFRISDSTAINASTFVAARPPVIVIDRGLLEFVRNEDELAFVIGHEMGHKYIREKLGYAAGDSDTKTEEQAADIISILQCVKAGYNYNAAQDFFRHLQENIKGGPPPTLLRLMAAHPLDGNRIAGVELALANENLFKSGTVQEKDYTPLEGVLAEKEDFALRDFSAAGYADCLKGKFGEDMNDWAYFNKVTPVIDRILKRSLPRDRVLILESLAQSLNIQVKVAQYIHDHLKPTQEDVIGSHLPVMGVEMLMWQMERNDELRKAVIDYLSDPLSKAAIEKISAVILEDERLVEQMTRYDFAEEEGSLVLDKFGEDRLNQALMDLHDNFTALGIDKKTAILSLLLVPGKDRLDEAIQSAAYDEAVQMVFPKVFNHDAKYAAEAESFVHAFLDTAKDFERAPILAALMALSSGSSGGSPDSGSAEKTVADQAARIMSLLGPAYVKLGQAINSNPQSPQDWKDATAGLKSDTRIEPRWEAILRIKELLPEEQGKHIIRFGPDLGSASFNSALEVEMDETYDMRDLVALVERPHAWTRAETGFDHLARTIDHWDHPVAAQYHDTISEMIAEALDMARVETDQDLGTRQYQRAQEIYGGTTVEFQDRTKLTITPVSLYATASK